MPTLRESYVGYLRFACLVEGLGDVNEGDDAAFVEQRGVSVQHDVADCLTE